MKNTGLKKWLRDNSSGVYRPAREAADLIDQLERELNTALADLSFRRDLYKLLEKERDGLYEQIQNQRRDA